MRVYDLIAKKRDGLVHDKEEIDFLINGYTTGEIEDYQMAAWLMAAFIQGLNDEETVHLTMAMVNTGKKIDLSEVKGIKVDKHSTGGVGDKTTIVLGPLVASVGVPVAKISGRGLGHTGGTLDKLESISGFNVNLTDQQFIKNVNDYGIAVMGQTAEIVPADKKIYALRDVTATVNSIPLIASSIMSKKIASGAERIVLDVKVGSGAFIKTYADAYILARKMVGIGNMVNRKTRAIISNMDQPLGYTIGNALEVKEAIATLKGIGPQDFTDLCLELGAQMVILAEITQDQEKAKFILKEAIDSGKALAKLGQFIEAQNGDRNIIQDLSLLPEAKIKAELLSPYTGYIKTIDAEKVGITCLILGGGRQKKDDLLDFSVGIELKKKVGDQIHRGECLAILNFNNSSLEKEAKAKLLSAYCFTDQPIKKQKIILGSVF